jgi:hypothetical protein
MASIQYTFKGQKLSLDILTSTTVADFLELIAEQTQVPVSGLKVMFKGKVLRPEESEESKPILEQHPVLASGAKIFVLGTTEQDLARVQAIDQHINTRKNYRPPPTAKVIHHTYMVACKNLLQLSLCEHPCANGS